MGWEGALPEAGAGGGPCVPCRQEQTQAVPFSPETVTKLVVRVRLGAYKLRAIGGHGGYVIRDEVRSDQHD